MSTSKALLARWDQTAERLSAKDWATRSRSNRARLALALSIYYLLIAAIAVWALWSVTGSAAFALFSGALGVVMILPFCALVVDDPKKAAKWLLAFPAVLVVLFLTMAAVALALWVLGVT